MRFMIAVVLLAGCGGPIPIASESDSGSLSDGGTARGSSCYVSLTNPIAANASAACSSTVTPGGIGVRASFEVSGRVVDLEIEAVEDHLSTFPFPGRAAVLSISGGSYCGEWSGTVREDTSPTNGEHLDLDLGCTDRTQPALSLNGTIDIR